MFNLQTLGESSAASALMQSVTPVHSPMAKQSTISVDGMIIPHSPAEGDELASLLEDGRIENDADDSSAHRSSNATKRMTQMEKAERPDRSEKRKVRLSHSHDGWNFRENYLWLWGGSQYSGSLCMVASSLCYSLMGLLVKLLAVHEIPLLETITIRCLVVAAAAAFGLKKSGHPLLGSPPVRLLLLARAAVGFLALSAFFYSLQVLPLRDTTFLNFTTPVFTALIARVVLQERFGPLDIAGCVSGILGIIVIARPPLLFGGIEVSAQAAAVPRHETLFGVLAAILAALLGAAALCLVRAIGKTGEPPLVTVFAFAAFSAPAAVLCLLVLQTAVLPSAVEILGMIVVGLVAFAAQVLLTRGLQLERAGKASAVQFVKMVATYFLGVLFLNDVPSVSGFMGSLIICVSVAIIATNKDEGKPEERA